jgi:transposase
MMGTHTPYSDEFKQEAVKLVTEQGMRRSQVARDLGIDPQTLRRWLAAAAPAAPSEPASAAAEVARLRRENEQLRMERDILKKAVGIFSRMPQ